MSLTINLLCLPCALKSRPSVDQNCQIDIDVIPLKTPPIVTTHSSSDTILSDHDLSSPFSEEEIITAISELRAGKAPGPEGVSLEMLSLGGEVTIHWLKPIFDTIWATESVTEDWQSQILVPLHKKGSRTNYRGIALLSIPGKVFAKAILNRLKPRAEQLLWKSQCGFCRGRGCADQLFSLQMLMEKAREYHQPIYTCFIDSKKALIQSIVNLSGVSSSIPIACPPSCCPSCVPYMKTLLLLYVSD